jgi:multimeric flavodoxin WrbA
MIGRCGRPGDEWQEIKEKLDLADLVVFASPVYFHHVTAQLKKLIDRFRSLFHVQITETGLTFLLQLCTQSEIIATDNQ